MQSQNPSRICFLSLQGVEQKMQNLETLVSSAGSVGTVFGFVGGVQTMAVWGLIIILVAGFVFLALYMRAVVSSPSPAQTSATTRSVAAKTSAASLAAIFSRDHTPPTRPTTHPGRSESAVHQPPATIVINLPSWLGRSKLRWPVIGAGLMLGAAVALATWWLTGGSTSLVSPLPSGISTQKLFAKHGLATQPAPQETAVVKSEKQVLGTTTPTLTNSTDSLTDSTADSSPDSLISPLASPLTDTVTIIVPAGVRAVNVRQRPAFDAPLVKDLVSSISARRTGETNGWIGVEFTYGKNQTKYAGWVSQEFIQSEFTQSHE